MFDKLQNDLLLKHPLLWNIKIVPILAVTLTLHVIFFGIGYLSGAVNFQETGFEYFSYDDKSGVVVTFSILISLLIGIVWLVYYFRNNAYKSYYPQSNTSLYKEWLLILLVSLLNCSYTASYFFARDLRARNYFAEEEFSRRIDILNMASLFAEGGYNSTAITEEHNGQMVRVEKETMLFRGREYTATSLMNKATNSFSYQSSIKDSLNELRVKTWLSENRKDSVLWLMNEFDKIAKSHDLKGNITPRQWLNLVYDYPDYNNYITVGKIDKYPQYSYPSYEYDDVPVQPQHIKRFDSLSNTAKVIDGDTYIFPKYHVPLLQLDNAYSNISRAWVSPTLNDGLGLFYLLFSFSLSMAIFSFRVTSGRGWLIALVIMGVTAMVTGLFSLASGGEGFMVIWLVILAGLLIYFLSVCAEKASKGMSTILLNNLLWLSIWFIPMVLSVLIMATQPDYGIDYEKREPSPFYQWLDSNSMIIMYCNFAFIIGYMYLLSAAIKKWKGIAEA